MKKLMRKHIYRFLQWTSKKFEAQELEIIPIVSHQEMQTKQVIDIQPEEGERKTKKSSSKKNAKKQTEKQRTEYNIEVEEEITVKKSRRKKPREGDLIIPDRRDIRDVMELMGFPLVSIYKKRSSPQIYEHADGSVKIKITPHTGHYLASIYDLDIILVVASRMQEFINNPSDIPPRTLIIPRHELLKELHKHDGKKEEKDLRASLSRLKLTGIETTIGNQDGRYDAGFGFLDSWGYTDRKDVKEFRITLSQWLYDGICKKGALLKTDPAYFKLTSGLKRFLYRTARKHVGAQRQWDFLVETIYQKSGSDREFKKFKHDLKKAVYENDIPGYSMTWFKKEGKEGIRFRNRKKELGDMLNASKQHNDKKSV